MASPGAAETWKTATTRQSDGESIFVDTDYLVERGNLLEIHVKYKVERDLFTLLLPQAEAEERYAIDCSARKFGGVYRKVTRGSTSSVERDALPTAVILTDIPTSSMIGFVADWACSEFKKNVAARQTTQPSAQQAPTTSQFTIPDDAIRRYQWKLIASAVPDTGTNDVYDTYVAEVTAQDVSKGIYVFFARGDYCPKTVSASQISRIVVARWGVGCSTRKLLVMEAIEFDGAGRVKQRHPYDEKASPADVQQGTVGQGMYDYVCGTSSAQAAPNTSQPASAPNLSVGTAWLSDRGFVVTAFHVIDGATEIALRTWDGKVYPATVVKADRPNDVAILSSSASAGLAGLPIARTMPGLGARVFTIGYPHPDVMGMAPKLTSGDISSLSGLQDDPRLLQISTPVQAGNSGGPLLNMNGEIVGLISAKLSAIQKGDYTQNVNYALKARYISGLLDDLAPQPSTTTLAARPAGRQLTLEELASGAQHSIFLIVGK